MNLTLLLLTACFSAKSPPPTIIENAAESSSIKKAATQTPPAEILPENAYQPRIFDFPDELMVGEINDELIRKNPMLILHSPAPPFDQPEKLLGWMDINVNLYLYLPSSLRNQEEFKEKAIKNGIPMGVELTETTVARVKPDSNTRESLYASDTTNGYLTGERPLQEFPQNATLIPITSTEINGETWFQVTAERTSDRESEKEDFEMLSNVGGVEFEDFSFAVDEGWIPASVTKPAIYADQYTSGLYTFESAVNGDLGIYVEFEEISFDGFDIEYSFLEASETDKLQKGDKVRIIWKKPASSTEESLLVWVPTF